MKKHRRSDIDDLPKEAHVVSEEDAEQVDLVTCPPDEGPRYLTDDVRALCASCGTSIKPRPHVPKLPSTVCIHCGKRIVEED
ncbi:MAG TPA: hypothetical protein VMM78_04975 [Thermomicrobiales bacterium]|nr:hypothetical protein [Thermomicrobiales bacterium]